MSNVLTPYGKRLTIKVLFLTRVFKLEQLRLKNIESNKELLAALDISTAKVSLVQTTSVEK